MIVLASASPRRRVLLQAAGVCFEVEPADVSEELAAAADPEAAAVELAGRKTRAVMERHADETVWVVGADTIVAVPPPGEASGPWRLLGKAADEVEAAGMLAGLSGTRHQVVTGVCVGRCPDGELASAAEVTWVTMRAITPGEIEAYVASGEWRDKAGGYAIQETADAFVTGLAGGGFDNVVGLPVELTLSLLRSLGAPLAEGSGRG